ncbi:IS3 family transposase [Paenibacillus sp. RC67]|uniref:IS3 family transposase n=1 Tax=Paenibacillus sp. RC67 TaxID=3039392 RepID=UPI0024ADE7D0|nr:IS3 family transposase [Paenibacillus sp. RC67]
MGVLLHSDQSSQFTSRSYNPLLEKNHMKASMSRKGNCYDAACMESFFGHLKSECLKLQKFETEEQLIQAVQDYIKFYNNERFQKKLNNLSPVQYRTKALKSCFFNFCLLDGGKFSMVRLPRCIYGSQMLASDRIQKQTAFENKREGFELFVS